MGHLHLMGGVALVDEVTGRHLCDFLVLVCNRWDALKLLHVTPAGAASGLFALRGGRVDDAGVLSGHVPGRLRSPIGILMLRCCLIH